MDKEKALSKVPAGIVKDQDSYLLGYRMGQEVIRREVESEIDGLMRELERDSKGSPSIEADTEGFNRGILMFGAKLKNRLSEAI